MGSDERRVEAVEYDFAATWTDWGNDRLSPAALESLAAQLAGAPITQNFQFDRPFLGTVTSAEVLGEALHLRGTVRHPLEHVAFAPGFRVKAFETREDGTRIITELDAPSIGLVWAQGPAVAEGRNDA